MLYFSKIKTPIGTMIAQANEFALFRLDFEDCIELDEKKLKPGKSKPLDGIRQELKLYFAGKLQEFKTPLVCMGSTFQLRVWQELVKIPFGATQSYSDIAKTMKKPTAFRAVAQANGANKFVIIIPCHRVINQNGELGGYSAGLHRKEWLLNHEKL